jgi:hypothetical protein
MIGSRTRRLKAVLLLLMLVVLVLGRTRHGHGEAHDASAGLGHGSPTVVSDCAACDVFALPFIETAFAAALAPHESELPGSCPKPEQPMRSARARRVPRGPPVG